MQKTLLARQSLRAAEGGKSEWDVAHYGLCIQIRFQFFGIGFDRVRIQEVERDFGICKMHNLYKFNCTPSYISLN